MFTNKKNVVLATALLFAFTQAYATGNSNQGNTTNNNQTYNTATSSNHNTNLNSNSQGQQQGQLQGQLQGQIQGQAVENANNAKQKTEVTVEGDTYKAKDIPVATAYAPSIAPTANCALSVSAGVQVMGFGGSFGKAYIDKNCEALEAVRSVSQVLGDKETAEAMMCQNVTYAKARATVGRPCAETDNSIDYSASPSEVRKQKWEANQEAKANGQEAPYGQEHFQ